MPDDETAATFAELERKLKELEDELQSASRGTPGHGAAPSHPALDPPAAPAPDPLEVARLALEELERFREQLERATRELRAEYDRVLGGLRAGLDAARQAPAAPANGNGAAAGPPPPVPLAPAGGLGDSTLLDGPISLDAGPFADIATLSGFERALASLPGVRDVHVRLFEGSRAQIDATLDEPVALGGALRRAAPVAFAITPTGPGRLAVAIEPGA